MVVPIHAFPGSLLRRKTEFAEEASLSVNAQLAGEDHAASAEQHDPSGQSVNSGMLPGAFGGDKIWGDGIVDGLQYPTSAPVACGPFPRPAGHVIKIQARVDQQACLVRLGDSFAQGLDRPSIVGIVHAIFTIRRCLEHIDFFLVMFQYQMRCAGAG